MNWYWFQLVVILLLLCFRDHHYHPTGPAGLPYATAAAAAMEEEESSSARGVVVEYLPGYQGRLPFRLETGYVGVPEEVELFYYFIESESNPKEDPLVLWLSGGPGCSSLTALVYQIGPLQFEAVEYNGSLPNLIFRPYSWTKVANVLFVDMPAEAGFSYAKTERASYSSDLLLCDQADEFMRKWLVGHPEYISNPFYVAGDSYSGITVPVITQVISDGNEEGITPYINLKGYILGNPITYPAESNYEIQFAYGMGLITDELYESLLSSCGGEYRDDYIDPNNLECRQNLQSYQQCISGIHTAQILEPDCGSSVASPIRLPSQRRIIEDQRHCPASTFYCRSDGYKLSYYWAGDSNVQQALHIRKGSIGIWLRCNRQLPYTQILDDVRPYHLNLSKKGYRSIIYSGDHDMIVPHQSTRAWIQYLNYSMAEPWRSWKVDGQIAGYTEGYSNNMTFVTVKGSGHAASEYTPEQCYVMFKRWISYQPL